MKKNLLLSFGLFLQIGSNAQCGSPVNGGSSTSMVTNLTRGCLNPVVADKDLNTIAFIHRTNTVTTGGNMGNLVYDISTNGGSTWTPDLGFLNPIVSSFARFPNLTLYNPPLNTTPSNAYIGYLASTVNSVSLLYDGVVSGVRQISGTGNTENYNQPIVNPSFIAGSVVKGAPGVFWAVDGLYNGTYVTGFTVYKGVWSSASNDIVWSNNFNASPSFNTGYTTTGAVPADYNIAFDPTGNTGYISFMGHLATGPAGYAYYPIFYKTIDGGTTWTGPTVVDVTQFSCLTANVSLGNIPSAGFEHDLVVDVNGNPHLVTALINGNNAYAVYYGLWHHLFDITLKNGMWAANDLGNVNTGRGTWGVAPNSISLDIFPRAARSADGTKIFFTWADNSSYFAGAANLTPDLFSKAYNVSTDMWTPTKNFSSCNVATAGKILFPHLAPEVLEPSSGMFQLAPVYAEFSTAANDPTLDMNFKFLDNATYAAADFSVAAPAVVMNIQPGPSLTLCPTSSITLNLGNPVGQFLWSNGSTSSAISITSGTATSYSVVAQVGCNVGTASVTVANMTVNANVLNPNICPGSAGTFTAAGNALGYTWTPGNATGTNVSVSPTTSTVTLTAGGSGSCTYVQNISINLLVTPTLNIAGTTTICAGTVLSQTVTGAQTYLWNDGSSNSTFTDTPFINTSYTVTGTAANTCTNTQTVSVVVKPTPTITATSNPSAVCNGQDAVLTSFGATTYSWNGTSSATSNMTITPTASGIYTVTGAGANLCEVTKTVEVVVYALPTITITPAKALFCKGEKIKLTASGASSYTWTSPGSLTFSVQVNPTVTTVYSLSASSAEGCTNSKTFTLTVSPCTGIDEQSNTLHLQIYPNPTTGKFVVKGEGAVDLKIINELGQVVKLLSLNESNAHEVSVEDLSGGIYFVVGQQGGLQVKQKLIVTR